MRNVLYHIIFFIHMHLSTGAYNIIKPRRFKASSSIIGYHYTASSYNQPILHHPTNNNIIFHPSSVSALLDRKCGRRLKIIIMGYPQFRSNSLRVDYRLSSSYVTFTQVLQVVCSDHTVILCFCILYCWLQLARHTYFSKKIS